MSSRTGCRGWITALPKAPGVRVTILVVDFDSVQKTRLLLLAPLYKRNHLGNLDCGLGNDRYPPQKDQHENCHGKKLTKESQEVEAAEPAGHSGDPTLRRDWAHCASILKVRILVVQTPQTIYNFPQKDFLRMRKRDSFPES